MINLLPSQYIERQRQNWQNQALRRWIISLGGAIVGLVAITLFGWVTINQQVSVLDHSISTTNKELEVQQVSKVQKEAAEISGDIRVINQVLNREIKFSSLITQIGSDMPSGTILSGLSVSKVEGSLDLSASAKDYASAAQISVNLSDPKNGLFSKVDINSISCTSPTSKYPCTVSLKALFDASAKSKFLGVAGP